MVCNPNQPHPRKGDRKGKGDGDSSCGDYPALWPLPAASNLEATRWYSHKIETVWSLIHCLEQSPSTKNVLISLSMNNT